MSRKFVLPLISVLVLTLIAVSAWFAIVPRSDIKRLEKGYVQLEYKNEQVHYTVVDKKPKEWIELKKISKKAYQAIVISEDWSFFQHDGVDVNQLKKATVDSVTGKRQRGASTISQQVVKNIFLTSEKTMTRKLKEMLITLYLEQNVSKEKILEIYLNVIEYGEGLYGIGKASRHYFKKSPDKLSARNGAFLAMLLPNPKRHAESFRQKELTTFAKKIIDDVLEKMKKAGYLDEKELNGQMNNSFGWEKKNTASPMVKRESEEGKTIHEKLRDKLENTTERLGKKSARGETFKRHYKEDRETLIGDEPDFDSDALIEDESGLEEEFRLD